MNPFGGVDPRGPVEALPLIAGLGGTVSDSSAESFGLSGGPRRSPPREGPGSRPRAKS